MCLKAFAFTLLKTRLLHESLSTLSSGSALCSSIGIVKKNYHALPSIESDIAEVSNDNKVSQENTRSVLSQEDVLNYIQLIHQEGLVGEQKFYCKVKTIFIDLYILICNKVIEELINTNELQEALSILDNTEVPMNLSMFESFQSQSGNISRDIIYSIIETTQEKSDISKYIIRMAG
jgi:hypothetical protein